MKAGIDLGATFTKAYWQKDGQEKFLSTAEVSFDELLKQLTEDGVTDLHAIGVGRNKEISGFNIKHDPQDPLTSEITIQSVGVRKLLERAGQKLNDFLIVSVGTGTSYTFVRGETVVQFPIGNGIGGGYIQGLAYLLSVSDCKQIELLASQGKPLDIFLRDRIPEFIGQPQGDFVLSHFGDATNKPKKLEDVMMTIFHCTAVSIVKDILFLEFTTFAPVPENIVYTGSTITAFPTFRKLLNDNGLRFGKNSLFPEHREFAAAIGAFHSETMI